VDGAIISDHDQLFAQSEDFSQRQIAAVAPVLSAPQLEVYRLIQRERLAQQKEFLEDRPQFP
jgi:hypothetical protein